MVKLLRGGFDLGVVEDVKPLDREQDVGEGSFCGEQVKAISTCALVDYSRGERLKADGVSQIFGGFDGLDGGIGNVEDFGHQRSVVLDREG